MFLDVLDTARTLKRLYSEQEIASHIAQGESMMYYSLLMGKKPVLTQTQMMDSNIIMNIVNDQYKEDFLGLIKEEQIQVCLYPGVKSISDYFVQCLSYGVNNDDAFFDFAVLDFLREEYAEDRAYIQKQIIKGIMDNQRNMKIDGLKQEETEKVQEYVITIEKIDKAIQGHCVKGQEFKYHMDAIFQGYATEILKSNQYSKQIKELIQYMNREENMKLYGNRRSSYYNVLEVGKEHFDTYAIEEVKQLIDCAYNRAVASIIDDKEGINININSEYTQATEIINTVEKCKDKSEILLQPIETTEMLTWEKMLPLLKEVRAIENKRKCTRIEALKEVRGMQLRKPVICLSKYFGLTATASLMPSIPVAGAVAILAGALIQDLVTEKLHKPSLEDCKGSMGTAVKNTMILNKAIKFNSLTAK